MPLRLPDLEDEALSKTPGESVSKPWHPIDYEEWCGHCGVLPHRRHPFWKPLESWSRINHGLPVDGYAHHVIYVALVGYTQIIAEIDWRNIILDVLVKDPL